jgi:4'-phosphopantetheinyl transferase EntD
VRAGTVIGELLPGDVATAESSGVVPEAALFPAELALVTQAVPKRRAEFATARHCARRALAELEVAAVPILSGANREPVWPHGVVGSITHCPGYHAAAVGRTTRFRSIGIDAEHDEPLPEGLLDQICLPSERPQLRATDGPHSDRLLFSAKETVYKTWFPLARRWLGFDDALVMLRPDGTFDVEVLVADALGSLQGRWLARDGLILTAIALPASDGGRPAGVSDRQE